MNLLFQPLEFVSRYCDLQLQLTKNYMNLLNLSRNVGYRIITVLRHQSFPITSDRPDISGKTEVGLTKYPATSDIQSGYFFGQFCFLFVFWSRKVKIGH